MTGTPCVHCGRTGFQKETIGKETFYFLLIYGFLSSRHYILMTTDTLVIAWDIHVCARLRSNYTVTYRVESIRSSSGCWLGCGGGGGCAASGGGGRCYHPPRHVNEVIVLLNGKMISRILELVSLS